MSKSKNWKANTLPGLAGQDLTLYISGDVDTGNKRKAILERRDPQGINRSQLLLEASPVNEGEPETYQPANYSEKITDRNQYTSIRIFKKGSEEVLADISKIEHLES